MQEAFDGQLPVEHGHDHVPVARLQAPVHDEQVPVEDARPGHRIARHAHHERRLRMLHQPSVQAQVARRVILRDGWEARPHGLQGDGHARARTPFPKHFDAAGRHRPTSTK